MIKIQTSILIIHYNKNFEIELILEAFLKQTIRANDFELIIIDDGSKSSIRPIINDYISKGLQIKLIENSHIGNRAFCRKLAVNTSKGENLIFLDSDMIPCNTFIEKHINNLSKNENIVSLGYRRLLYPYNHNLITPEIIRTRFDVLENYPCYLDERIAMINMHEKLQMDLSDAWYICYSHNIALKRNLYESVQGFDEGFRFGWGVEDVDFGLQLHKAGAFFYYDNTIISYHLFHEDSSDRREQYNKNLLYFYEKYHSYEPEIFMLQHRFDTYTICTLYKLIRDRMHRMDISEIKDFNIKNCKKTLFIGFTLQNKVINENRNCYVCTENDFADYNLTGAHLPYEDKEFNESIISGNYNIFPTEFLFIIIKEAKRVSNKVYFIENGKKSCIDVFWKQKTGFTFSSFCKLIMIRVLITPGSEHRQNNVLFIEFIKALNDNGFYASLDLAYDDYKDNSNIYPYCHECNTQLYEYYHRNLFIFTNSVITITDKPNQYNNSKSLWWTDIKYYGEIEDDFENEKSFCNVVFRNCIDNKKLLRPGIRAENINNYLMKNKTKRTGIVIADLTLENLSLINEFIKKINERNYLRTIPITIITLNLFLEENRIFKNDSFHCLDKMNIKKQKYILQFQKKFSERFSELIDSAMSNDNINIIHSCGSLNEFDTVIQNNSIYIDFNNTREISPYVLQAAAYGLQVYTTSDSYNNFNYENIRISEYELKNALYDNPNFLNYDNTVKQNILFFKRQIKIDSLLDLILENINLTCDLEYLIKNNSKNDWKKILEDDNIKQIFNKIDLSNSFLNILHQKTKLNFTDCLE